MRSWLILVAVLALTDLALGAVGETGVQGQADFAPLSSLPENLASGEISAQLSQELQGVIGAYLPYLPSGASDQGTSVPGSVGFGSSGYAGAGAGQGPGYYSGVNPYQAPGVGGGAAYQPSPTAFQSGQYTGYPSSGVSGPQASYAPGTMGYSSPPEISGPYQDGFSPVSLKLVSPGAENFVPQGSLDFSPATPPAGMSMTGQQGAGAAWYWPGSGISQNRFLIQTSSGMRTIAACPYGGYLPLWSDIQIPGNFFTYEWSPGQPSPTVRWWGWTWQGYKRGWFTGDSAGWHVLTYYSGAFSNYIYIYVYPPAQSAGGYGMGQVQTPPFGAPMAPTPLTEGIRLPDYSMVQPRVDCQTRTCSQEVYAPQPVFPQSSQCRCQSGSCGCNGYYVQVWPGKLTTVAGAVQGQWMPLWSKIGMNGAYWSYEWAPCTTGMPCAPLIKGMGTKGPGWFPTWFVSNKVGWHILAYHNGDWSNYVYIYVWPTSCGSNCPEPVELPPEQECSEQVC